MSITSRLSTFNIQTTFDLTLVGAETGRIATHIMTSSRTRVGGEKAATLATFRPALRVVMEEKSAFTSLSPSDVSPANTGPCQSSPQMATNWMALNTATLKSSHRVSDLGKR